MNMLLLRKKKYVKITIISLIISLAIIPFAIQNNRSKRIKDIKSIDFLQIDVMWGGENFYFPYVHSKDSMTEFKINTFLQLKYLGGSFLTNPKEFLKKICSNLTYSDFKFEIFNNSENCLSIKIESNKSSESFSRQTVYDFYNFNPQNGDVFLFQNLFDTCNKKLLLSIIRDYVIENMVPSNDKFHDSISKFNIRYFYDSTYILPVNVVRNFYFHEDSIYIDLPDEYPTPWRASCDKNYFKVRELSNFVNIKTKSIPINILTPILNNYGRAIILNSPNLKYLKSEYYLNLYKGRINQSRICYFLLSNLPKFYPSFKDLKQQLMILKENRPSKIFEGKSENNYYQLTLQKSTGDGYGSYIRVPFNLSKFNENIFFKTNGDTLVGTWISADNKKKLPFWAVRI